MFSCLVQLVKMLSCYWNHNNKLSFINTDNSSMFLTIYTPLQATSSSYIFKPYRSTLKKSIFFFKIFVISPLLILYYIYKKLSFLHFTDGFLYFFRTVCFGLVWCAMGCSKKMEGYVWVKRI